MVKSPLVKRSARRKRHAGAAAAAAGGSSGRRNGEASTPNKVGERLKEYPKPGEKILLMLYATDDGALLPQFTKVHTSDESWALRCKVPAEWQRPPAKVALVRTVAGWVIEKAYAAISCVLPGHGVALHEFEECVTECKGCPCRMRRGSCKLVTRASAKAAGVSWTEGGYPRVALGRDKDGAVVYESLHRLMCWARSGVKAGAATSVMHVGGPDIEVDVDGAEVLRVKRCVSKQCIHPLHLKWGSPKDNSEDHWGHMGYQWGGLKSPSTPPTVRRREASDSTRAAKHT